MGPEVCSRLATLQNTLIALASKDHLAQLQRDCFAMPATIDPAFGVHRQPRNAGPFALHRIHL
jgi:hypothetical protein